MAHQLREHTQAQTSTQINALREELDAANKKFERYVHLVASLSEELDNLRRSICHNCKTKFVPFYAPIAPLSLVSDGLLPSRIQQVIGPQIQPHLPSILTTYAGKSLDSSIPIHSAMSPPPRASSSTQLTTTRVEEIHPKQPKWSVSYNPRIKQALHIDLGKTFTFTSMVCCKFSPNGKYLAVGLCSGSGKTYLYDVETGLKICCLVDLYLKNRPTVWCVQFSPDNKYIATATASGKQIRLWEIARKRTRVAFRADAVSLCFSPNGRFLITAGGKRGYIWSLRDGSLKRLLDDVANLFSITFSPDGRHIASMDFDCWLRIWNARTGRLLDLWKGHSWDGLCVAFTSDGKGLVSGGGDGILRYWDVSSLADGRDREMIGGTFGRRFPQIRKFEGHTLCIRSISFSPDSRWIATGSRDETVRIWNPITAEYQCTLNGHDAYARTVDFSPAGKYIASGGEDRRVRLWEYREV